MDKKYITIKEYADIRGVSVSSVYKRLNTTLQQYLVEVENRKMLNIEVLEAEGLKKSNGEVEENSTSEVENSSTPLQKQLEAKDRQIEALNELIKSLQDSNKQKDDFIQEQSKKLTELLEQSNILLQNNQLLLADKKKDKKEDIVVNDAEIVNESIDDSPEDKDNENNDNINKEKKGFFSRLFGR